MERRQVISGLCMCALSVVSGCSELTGSDIDTATKIQQVEDWEFEIEEVMPPDSTVEQPPQITCFPPENRVRVTGVMYQGRSCDTVAPKSMSLSGDDFRIVIAEFDTGNLCGDELRTAEYSVDLEFKGEIPSRVTAIESTIRHGEKKTTQSCQPG